jgi:hypothetical protein
MKVILIPCAVLFLRVAVVDAADKHLRGSNRDLQFTIGGGGGGGGNLISGETSMQSAPVTSQTQPNQTPNPTGNGFPFKMELNNVNIVSIIPTFPGSVRPQPTDTPLPLFGGFGGGSNFDLSSIFGPSIDSGTGLFLGPPVAGGGLLLLPPEFVGDGDGGGFLGAPIKSGGGLIFPPSFGGGPEAGGSGSGSSGNCPRSGAICTLNFDPVDCEGGCRYGNLCEARGAGFSSGQCAAA